MKIAIVAIATMALALYFATSVGEVNSVNEDLSEEFMKFIGDFGKNYNHHDEYRVRFNNFVESYNKIQEHNSMDGRSYYLEINHLADWHDDELTAMLALKTDLPPNPVYENFSGLRDSKPVDWREHEGIVESIKDQGQCGSCWSFSAAGAFEGRYNLLNDNDDDELDASEQQLCDCDRKKILGVLGNMGCKGGLMWKALDWYKKNGADSESQYPYVSGDGSDNLSCSSVESKRNGKGHTFIKQRSWEDMKEALSEGPVSVAINAGQECFRFYKGGILSDCKGEALDHGVLAVGWETEDDMDYIIVKNSWGERWGEHGYARVTPDSVGILLQGTIPKF